MSENKILVVSEIFWPEGGGAELATYLILKELATKAGYSFTVITSTRNPVSIPGVTYVFTTALRYRNRVEKFMMIPKLRKVFEKMAPNHDTVYIVGSAYSIIPEAKKMGLRVIAHLHNYALVSYSSTILACSDHHDTVFHAIRYERDIQRSISRSLLAPISFWLYKYERAKALNEIERIICVSRRQAEIISEQAPEIKEKIKVVYNPLPEEVTSTNFVKEPSDIPTLLYVGGDSYLKGFDILLQAIKMLDKKGIKAKMILAGRYGDEAMNKIQSLEQKLNNVYIEVVGKTMHRKLVEMHRHAWALLFPSISEEPLPYAVVEAMTLGTTPIASRVGGVPEIVEGTVASRYLFRPCSTNEFHEKLYDLSLLSPSDVKKMSTSLRDVTLARFSKENIASGLIKLFVN